ncbi:PD40 domain-containing protein [bacterium]|nr:PD40 domain-containing protein [bacterium]
MRKAATLILASVILLFAGCLPRLSDHIYFASDRDGVGNNLFAINTDGGELRQLTKVLQPGWDPHPALSPDGKRIVFVSRHADGNLEVYVMDTAGGEPTRLTYTAADEDRPAFTPDGRISFDSERTGDWELWVMDQTGENPIQLTDSPGIDEGSSWSPDGKLLTFASEREGYFGIYLADPDGSGVRRLYGGISFHCNDPAWSPDGKRIAFAGDSGGTYDIYVIALDGSEPLRLTGYEGWSQERYPSWSADGERIVFARLENGDWEICTMKADGSEVRQLTDNLEVDDSLPVW